MTPGGSLGERQPGGSDGLTAPNYGSTPHRLAAMSNVIDVLMAVAVEFFHGDADLMWQRLGPGGKAVIDEWAGLRHFDATGIRPPHTTTGPLS